MKERLMQICRCMDELDHIREAWKKELHPNDQIGCTVGECDWLEALHRILYEL